jgi:type I restriction enzyme M protein
VDIDSLSKYWDVFPSLKVELLSAINEKYYSLKVEHENIRQTIYKNAEFSDYGEKLDEAFAVWKAKEYPVLSTLDEDVSAREVIESLAEDILAEFEHLTLIDKYDVYQVLLAYWNEVMNDDVSLIISEPDRYANARATDNIEEEITQGKNKGEMKVTGWEGRLIPKTIVIDTFFREEKNAIEEVENVVAETESQLSDLIESADEESALADVAENGKVKAKDIETKIAELTQHVETEETDELTNLMVLLPMQKKRLQAYLVGHPLCESVVNDKGNVTKTAIIDRLTIIRTVESVPESLQDDVNQLKAALEFCGKVSDYNKVVKELNKALDEKCRAKYENLTDEEILDLLVNRKWFDSIFSGVSDLYAAISHHLTNRIIELAERYETTLPQLESDTMEDEAKVKSHLERMGFKW